MKLPWTCRESNDDEAGKDTSDIDLVDTMKIRRRSKVKKKQNVGYECVVGKRVNVLLMRYTPCNFLTKQAEL